MGKQWHKRPLTNSSTDEFGCFKAHPRDGRLVFVIDEMTGKIDGIRWASWSQYCKEALRRGDVFNFRHQAKEAIEHSYPDYKAKLSPAEIEQLEKSL